MRAIRLILAFFLGLTLLSPALAETTSRALLIACKEFSSQPDLGNATSGNLQIIASALLGASPRPSIYIEDGTIGTLEALDAAVHSAFSEADENDLSILYLCTHGVLTSSDDAQVYLLLGDGQSETPLNAQNLYELISDIQGEKLLILDACHSGALIGRGSPTSGTATPSEPTFITPFLMDSSIHVLASASGGESSWYYDSENLSTGALSYFASAVSSGLGLYGMPEADADGDGVVTLGELHRHLRVAVPSSSSQLLSSHADGLVLPTSQRAMLSRPLTGFSYGSSLLMTDDPTLEFSFTAAQETAVQYRLVDFDSGKWNWEEAQTFLDPGDNESGKVFAGRKTRSLTLSDLSEQDSGYLMLQVFSVLNDELILCSERLIAVQSTQTDAQLFIDSRGALASPGSGELPITITLDIPAELTVSVMDAQGKLVRRLAQSRMTRPGSATHLFWDGLDAQGEPVANGAYTITAEALLGGRRQKVSCDVMVGS